MSNHLGFTLRDMFDVPISMGAHVVIRHYTLQWGWVTVKGIVIGQIDDRVKVRVIEYSRSTSAGPNERPTQFSPAASAVIVINANAGR